MTDTKDTQAQTPAVRVRELVWDDEGRSAETPFGQYVVYVQDWKKDPDWSMASSANGYFGDFTSQDDAKDAAQADFTARIMGALETTSMQGWQEKRIAELEAEVDDLKINVVAFAAPFMVQYAQAAGFPDGAILGHHYDILQKAGARMDSFIRYVPPLKHKD